MKTKFKKGEVVLVKEMTNSNLSDMRKYDKKTGRFVSAFKPRYKYIHAKFDRYGKEKGTAYVKSSELAMSRVNVPFPLYKKLKVEISINRIKKLKKVV
jgi:hypothetical protein